MSGVIQVKDLKGRQYNCARSSAVDQKTLLHLMGARITTGKANLSAAGKSSDVLHDVGFIVSMLLRIPESEYERVEYLTNVRNVRPHGSTEPVDLKHFDGNMTGYYHIIAGLLRENLLDFFTWLSSDLNEEESTPTKVKGKNK